MAQATLKGPLNKDDTLSVAFIIARNGDPLTLALRGGRELDHEDLWQLHEASSSTLSSLGSSSTAASASRELSIVTKPTSYGTDYPAHDYNGKDSVRIEYASSLSATHGSESEAEPESDDVQRTALFGTGAWSSSRHDNDRCLRRHESTRLRLSTRLPSPRKKFPIVIHRPAAYTAAERQEGEVVDTTVVAPLAAKLLGACPRDRIPPHHYISFGLILLVLLAVFVAGTLVGGERSCSMILPLQL